MLLLILSTGHADFSNDEIQISWVAYVAKYSVFQL